MAVYTYTYIYGNMNASKEPKRDTEMRLTHRLGGEGLHKGREEIRFRALWENKND